MEKFFRVEGNMAVMQGAPPIRIVHHRSFDKPSNHVLHLNNYIEIYFGDKRGDVFNNKIIDTDHSNIFKNAKYCNKDSSERK